MNDYIIHREDELEHHGILGMKWGVRRYQNPDGSLTNAGKLRYRVESITGTYDPKGNNPYVSERRKKNRLKEIEEFEQYKQKEKKRSEIRKDLEKQSVAAGKEAENLRKESDRLKKSSEEKKAEQKELKKESKALKKSYVAGQVASRSALTMVSSMAISMINDKMYGRKIDSGTIVRGALLGIASVPIVAMRTAIEEGSTHREAERKHGLRK